MTALCVCRWKVMMKIYTVFIKQTFFWLDGVYVVPLRFYPILCDFHRMDCFVGPISLKQHIPKHKIALLAKT